MQILKKKDERGVMEMLSKELDLEQVMDRNVENLSGGELQRFAIAVCAATDSQVYMIDEPSSYLDVRQRLKAAQARSPSSYPTSPAQLSLAEPATSAGLAASAFEEICRDGWQSLPAVQKSQVLPGPYMVCNRQGGCLGTRSISTRARKVCPGRDLQGCLAQSASPADVTGPARSRSSSQSTGCQVCCQVRFQVRLGSVCAVPLMKTSLIHCADAVCRPANLRFALAIQYHSHAKGRPGAFW